MHYFRNLNSSASIFMSYFTFQQTDKTKCFIPSKDTKKWNTPCIYVYIFIIQFILLRFIVLANIINKHAIVKCLGFSMCFSYEAVSSSRFKALYANIRLLKIVILLKYIIFAIT